jgi:Calx-beta domain/Carboxypeptidase regulatory-like domain/Pectate lyase superfamily protein
MKLPIAFLLLFGWLGLAPTMAQAQAGLSFVGAVRSRPALDDSGNVFNLADFGAVGNGLDDAGPALQRALDAMGEAGGGTLFVPAGRYAINTPVRKDFSGLAAEISILGVASLTPAPPPNSSGYILTRGLDLQSEFAPRTGAAAPSIKISGLESFLIQDVGFIGTPGVVTDAFITLALNNIRDARVKHCEFYGLSSLSAGGAIVQSVRSGLTIADSVFLGSTGNSGVYVPVVENIEWQNITVTNTVFVDYGQRPELWGKLDQAPPLSWITIGNAAAPEADSPRREAVIKDVFFDEGALFALASLPYRYTPASAPIDLVYVSGVYMNVSNLGTSGFYLYGIEQLLIEDSHYGWSHNADSAISLLRVKNAILDRVECSASADRIRADAATGSLTIIDSVYNHLDSLAQTTRVITTNNADEDAVQYVRRQFSELSGHAPDPAAHFFWSDQVFGCTGDVACENTKRTALQDYLKTSPQEKFRLSGRIVEDNGAGMPGITVTLAGSQNVTTETDAAGDYEFSSLPTSGIYSVLLSRTNYTLRPERDELVTPDADRVFNAVGTLSRHTIQGRMVDATGNSIPNVTISLSGSQQRTTTSDNNGSFSFADVPSEGDYTVTPTLIGLSFNPSSATYDHLDADQYAAYVASAAASQSLSGRVTETGGNALGGVIVSLSGSESGTATTDANGDYSFTVFAGGNYTITPEKTNYLFAPAGASFGALSGNQLADFQGAQQTTVEFSANSYTVTEGTKTIAISVIRSGNTEGNTEVVYLAKDGTADQRSDIIPVIGRLTFTAGETSKSFLVFITDDVLVEPEESLTLELSDVVGAGLGNNRSAILNILDNDSDPAAPNPIDDPQFFVRQHYRDFLNRPPDAAGLDFWSKQISSCGADAACLADRRMNVSAAFFLSIEFQQTGFLVYRLYETSYGEMPRHFDEFLLDTRTIAAGVVVNAPGWEQLLAANTTQFLERFVTRSQFINAYPVSLTPAEFVNVLNNNAGGLLPAGDIDSAIAEFAGAATSEATDARARVLRRVAENPAFSERQLNPAFVLMQYFGYLQRNPSEAPDENLDGYSFWLNKLLEFNGDFRSAEMVKSFLVSGEYRSRFGAP